jgi:hypothetical protein
MVLVCCEESNSQQLGFRLRPDVSHFINRYLEVLE